MRKIPRNSRDLGPYPALLDLNRAAIANHHFRVALWTGPYLQVTLMSIPSNGQIGVEMHDHLDQLLRVESGSAKVFFGASRRELRYVGRVQEGSVVIVPAGTWHDLVNIGKRPLKLSSIYAPPQHSFGVLQRTKEEADAAH